jgi:DNA-binding GntR family transcriptional regulator
MTPQSNLQPLPVMRVADAGLEALRRAILDGELPPGKRLIEEELAAQMGISRTPLRRALAVLEAEGLVEAQPRHGVRVRVYTADEVDDLYRLRAVLEGEAARRAADAITPNAIENLEASCDRLEGMPPSVELREAIDENLIFHNVILDLAGSRRLRHMVRNVIALPVMYQQNIWSVPGQLDRSRAEHRALVVALGARQRARSERIMRAHILTAKEIVLAQMAEGTEALTNQESEALR